MSCFIPDIMLDSVLDIQATFLQNSGIRGVILDVDNTLTSHGNPEPADGVLEWLDSLRMAGIQIMIVSNNRRRRIQPFADRLGLPFVSMGCKPMTFGITRACKRFGLPPSAVAMVGDQIYTDTVAGNLKGLKTILVTPVQMESNLFFKCKRTLERPFIRLYDKKRRG